MLDLPGRFDGRVLEVALEVRGHVGGVRLAFSRFVQVIERLLERLVLLLAPCERGLELAQLRLDRRRVVLLFRDRLIAGSRFLAAGISVRASARKQRTAMAAGRGSSN